MSELDQASATTDRGVDSSPLAWRTFFFFADAVLVCGLWKRCGHDRMLQAGSLQIRTCQQVSGTMWRLHTVAAGFFPAGTKDCCPLGMKECRPVGPEKLLRLLQTNHYDTALR